MLKKKEDPHPITLMITQLPTGKSKSILTRYDVLLFFPNLTCVYYCDVACSHNLFYYVNEKAKQTMGRLSTAVPQGTRMSVFALLGG